ncbi:MAG: cellulase family glycosylhydrolase [Phycisphaerae bacterium]|nr:cellulase family glycosylhydrolase [Phycisphaerae bacterium]
MREQRKTGAFRIRRLVTSAGTIPERGHFQFMDPLEPRVMLAADPIAPQDNPLWLAPKSREITIDGVLNEPGWDSAHTVVQTQAFRADGRVTTKFLWTDDALFVAFDVRDAQLWADGNGAGAGDSYELEGDDSVTVYLDLDDSRDEFFQAGDRAFGANLGNPTDPLNGTGIVRRAKWDKGNGAGGTAGVIPGNTIDPGIAYSTRVNGTVNNNADTDVGWVTEICFTWAALGITRPVHGQTIGVNYDVIFDNEGGRRDFTDYRSSSQRFTKPAFIDDHVEGVFSSYTASQAGLRGPVNYAELMFLDGAAGEKPARISSLDVNQIAAYGARVDFLAPAGTTTGKGHVSAYEIRYATTAITNDTQWLKAAVFENAYVPRLQGAKESLRVTGLAPQTTYFVAVRAVDGNGNLSDITSTTAFTTGVPKSATDKGKIVVSPMGGTLIYENGTAFVPVGDHLGLSFAYTRNLYPGTVWDNTSKRLLNFNTEPSFEGTAGAYFDLLKARGVNTMRIFLELPNLPQVGNTALPDGLYWTEYNRGQFNDNMRQFITNLLIQAASHDMYLIFSPFDTFAYSDPLAFVRTPFASARGGAINNINDFFQNAQTLDIAKARFNQLAAWVKASPNADHLLGWEPLNEWDSYGWTLNAEGNAEPGRETELRRRSIWVNDLATYVRTLDPERLLFNSTIVQDPRGPVGRAMFLSRTHDVLAPHLYTNPSEEPINNPAADRKILAAIETANLTAYNLTRRNDPKPVLNGEWGMTRSDWPGGVPAYSAAFTQNEDEAIFRTVLWSGFASGLVGTGLRIPADELTPNAFLLTDVSLPITTPSSIFNLPGQMRPLQQTFSRFVNSTSLAVSFGSFQSFPLTGLISAAATGRTLLAWGVSDGRQGVAYILQDGNKSNGTVTGATVTIGGLSADVTVDVEIWSTLQGVTGPIATLANLFVSSGTLSFVLPDFTQDVAVKFKARAAAGQVQVVRGGKAKTTAGSQLVTFSLGIDRQPIATILNNATGQTTVVDVAGLANFRGSVLDMTAYTTKDGLIKLALTDERHHLWVLDGNLETNTWTATDQTAASGQPGLTGDLSSFLPSWGAQHISGLDARGHTVFYWIPSPAQRVYNFSDLTQLFGGPLMQRGLTGYIAPGDGLSLAGLNADGEVILYYWGPNFKSFFGKDDWQFVNFTKFLQDKYGQSSGNFDADRAFAPKLFGQLDAYVTDYGGLNIAGLDENGNVRTYWYAPDLGFGADWKTANVTAAAGSAGVAFAKGVEAVVGDDQSLNLLGTDASGNLHSLRFSPSVPKWVPTNVSTASAANVPVIFALGSAATGNRIVVAAPRSTGDQNLIVFSFFISSLTWQSQVTTQVALGQ